MSNVKSAANYSANMIDDISKPEISHPSNFEKLYTMLQTSKDFFTGIDIQGNSKTQLINCIQVLQSHISNKRQEY